MTYQHLLKKALRNILNTFRKHPKDLTINEACTYYNVTPKDMSWGVQDEPPKLLDRFHQSLSYVASYRFYMRYESDDTNNQFLFN